MNIEINLDDHLQEVLQESKQRLTATLESWLESSDVTIYPAVLRDLSLIDTEIQDRLFGIRRLMIASGALLSVSVRIELAKIKALAQFCTAANSALDHQRALYKQISEPAVFTPTSEAVESVLVSDDIQPAALKDLVLLGSFSASVGQNDGSYYPAAANWLRRHPRVA